MRYQQRTSLKIGIVLFTIWGGFGEVFRNTEVATFAGSAASRTRCVSAGQADCPHVIMGYYRSWGGMEASAIPWNSLTHISHAFVEIQDDGRVKTQSQIPSVTLTHTAHRHGVKALLAIGGTDSGDQLFDIAKAPVKRKTFVNSVVSTVKAFGYDGVDLDWEYPTKESAEAFHTLLGELKSSLVAQERFGSPLLLSAAVPPSDWHGQWMRADRLTECCDLIQVMAYDFTGPWSTRALHHSAVVDTDQHIALGGFSVRRSLVYWLAQRRVPASKILVGLPLYGRVFEADSIAGPIRSKVERGTQPATLTISKVNNLIDAGWRRVSSPSPWLQSPRKDALFAFDDPTSIKLKCTLARESGCRGAFVWALGDEGSSKQRLLETAFATFHP